MELAGVFDRQTRTLTVRSAGAKSDDGRSAVAGTIFNEEELRQRFAVPDAGLAEIVAALHRRLGADGVAELDGMFALALWDEQNGRGLLAQDQLGTMSLFYFESGARLFFASEIRELLALLPATPPPDEISLAHLLANSDPPAGRTPYAGVMRLGAAHLLELDSTGWRRRRYWWPRYARPLRASSSELSELLWNAVTRAVAVRAPQGDRAGVIMSGGVDSSVVAAAAAAVTSDARGYSAVFPGRPELDESARIDRLVDGIGLENVQYEILPSGGLRASLEYLRRWSVPASGPGLVLELPLTSRAASDGVDVLLDGQGGNEVFGFSPYLLADRIRRGRLLSSIRLARRFPLALERPPWSQSAAIWRLFGLGAAAPLSFLQRRRRQRAIAPAYLRPRVGEMFHESFDPLDWRRGSDGPLWWAFKVDMLVRGREQTRLADYLRHRAASVGIEARPPLMDRALVDLSLRLPPEADFDSRYDRPLIRAAMALGGVPDDVRLDRAKSDLGDFYFDLTARTDFPFIRSLLADPDACLREYVTSEALTEIAETPPPTSPRGSRHWSARMWNLAIVETFLRQLRDPDFVERTLDNPELSSPQARLRREHALPQSSSRRP